MNAAKQRTGPVTNQSRLTTGVTVAFKNTQRTSPFLGISARDVLYPVRPNQVAVTASVGASSSIYC